MMPLPGMGEGLEREGGEERQSLLEDSLVRKAAQE